MKVILLLLSLGVSSYARPAEDHVNKIAEVGMLGEEIYKIMEETLEYIVEEATKGNAEVGNEIGEFLKEAKPKSMEVMMAFRKEVMDGTMTPESGKKNLIALKQCFIETKEGLKANIAKLPEENAKNIHAKIEDMFSKVFAAVGKVRAAFHQHDHTD